VTVPLGGAGDGSLRPWLVTSPVGVVSSLYPLPGKRGGEGAARNTAVERREARRPDRKGRKDASQASRRASQHVMGARNTQRFSALRSPSLARKSKGRGEKELNDYGRAGAAKQAASGAVPMRPGGMLIRCAGAHPRPKFAFISLNPGTSE
jgi:hypothetical protein